MSTTTIDSSTNETSSVNTDNAAQKSGVVETLLELGFAWAAYGLKIATNAVEHSSRILGVTAKALDKLAEEFAGKSGEAKSAK